MTKQDYIIAAVTRKAHAEPAPVEVKRPEYETLDCVWMPLDCCIRRVPLVESRGAFCTIWDPRTQELFEVTFDNELGVWAAYTCREHPELLTPEIYLAQKEKAFKKYHIRR